MDNIQFTPGTIGTPIIKSVDETGISDPSSTKQNLNGTTGLVVLASDGGPNFYFHNVLALNSTDIPNITVRPMAFDFGGVLLGTSPSMAIEEVRNDGEVDLSVTASMLAGTDPDDFSIADGQAPFTLAPGFSRDVLISFSPGSAGIKNAVFSIVSNDPDENTVNVGLQGTSLADADGDGVLDNLDNCPNIANSDQTDADDDGRGDACETCDNDPDNVADGDGICGDIEDAGPNRGDANEDAIPDSQQANVASLQTSDGTGWVTLESPTGTTLSDTHAADNPSPADAPTDIDFDQGFIGFTVQGLAAGDATIVTITLPAGAAPISYYKYGPPPSNANPHWYEFIFDGQTGAEVSGNIVTLHFVDGQRGDDDLTANGIIIDVKAPGVNVDTGGGGGGCFIRASSQDPGWGSAVMLSVIGSGTTALAAWLRQKRKNLNPDKKYKKRGGK